MQQIQFESLPESLRALHGLLVSTLTEQCSGVTEIPGYKLGYPN